MFPQPFQYLDARYLPDIVGCFAMAWVVFGIPSVLGMCVISWLLRRFKMYGFEFLKRPGFRASAFVIPLCGLLFGMASGYFAAWTYRHDLETRQESSWYDVVAIPGAPGDAMANVYGGDWQDDEAWDYRSDIAIWNGLFWWSVASGGMMLICLASRRLREQPDDLACLPSSI